MLSSAMLVCGYSRIMVLSIRQSSLTEPLCSQREVILMQILPVLKGKNMLQARAQTGHSEVAAAVSGVFRPSQCSWAALAMFTTSAGHIHDRLRDAG